jgi:large conductance mechanosensitive channel
VRNVLNGFKEFIARGNVIDLAVAVVIGAAFNVLVQSLVKDLLTPAIAAVFGEPDFSGLHFTIHGSQFNYGNFLNALLAFLSVAAAIYFFVVLPLNKIKERENAGKEPTIRACPQCLSEIPAKAVRCRYCSAKIA